MRAVAAQQCGRGAINCERQAVASARPSALNRDGSDVEAQADTTVIA